ncbi:MAG: hypothetical protein WC757_04995 [Candidatus Paceibacterota bacterium]|jgi:hypothetical protein
MDKIMLFKKELYIGGIIILSCLASFALGRLSVADITEGGTRVCFQDMSSVLDVNAQDSATTTDQNVPNDGQVVASKSGTKYHFPWCSGAKTISDANKITFASIEEARTKGYLPAANCKGLK